MPSYEPEQNGPQEPRRRCRHIFTAGRRCGSPCLRSEQFCYHHHTTRRPVQDPLARRARTELFSLPDPEDREAVRAAVAQVMHAVAQNAIDLKRAGMVLYSLQIALCTFPPLPRPAPSEAADNSIPLNDIAEDIVVDETHGLIAPEDEYQPPPESGAHRSFGRRLLDEVERYEARQARQEALDFFEAEDARLEREAIEDARKYGIELTPAGAGPVPASGTSASPAPRNHREPVAKLLPHRPAAIDLRAAAAPETSRHAPREAQPGPQNRQCQPDLQDSKSNRESSGSVILSGVWRAFAPNEVEGPAVRAGCPMSRF